MESCRFQTPLGEMVAAAENNKLKGIWFTGQAHFPMDYLKWENNEHAPVLMAVKEWIEAYFNGEKPSIQFQLDPEGTPFQKRVWKVLLEIPYGSTLTYGEISKRVGLEMGKESMSAQAVGGAIGRNPISIIIPCHRVIGANKSLTGYAGGIEKKEALLRLEGFLKEN